MRIRPFAEFEADFPYDGVEGDETVDFEEIVPPARNVAEAIGLLLGPLGHEISPPIQDNHGWWINIKDGRRRYELYVGFTYDRNTYVLHAKEAFGLWLRSDFPNFLTKLNSALNSDHRFSKARWSASLNDKTTTDTPIVE